MTELLPLILLLTDQLAGEVAFASSDTVTVQSHPPFGSLEHPGVPKEVGFTLLVAGTDGDGDGDGITVGDGGGGVQSQCTLATLFGP